MGGNNLGHASKLKSLSATSIVQNLLSFLTATEAQIQQQGCNGRRGGRISASPAVSPGRLVWNLADGFGRALV